MTTTDYDFLPNSILPDRDAIITKCKEAGFCGGTGFPLRDANGEAIIAWVKYGPYVTVNEARTQDFASKELARTPDFALVKAPRVFDAFQWEHPAFTLGCIVMEYVDGSDCGPVDVDDVAKAVQRLIDIRGPDLAPGHIGGTLVHSFFFLDWVAPARYTSVTDLQDHINNILKHKGDSRRVDIVSEAENGLFLCPCDIDPGNFRRRSIDGQLFALDFGATCLLPSSFFAVAMRLSENRFCRKVAQRVTYNEPEDVSAIVAASYYLVQFGAQPVALPRRLQVANT
ncbi:hypothetical protein BD626DRAFT_492381 [Schizophyllum amplum]|uniref:Aminoglycoside phosphotransferase domain-containing protein n=1 Tax=Schizophyllum amplum TaxID=97359 RepID=A0A550CIF6_9AGAR|nr:hypothetical protein BD626DRAFT_492381 [Auriculariopsis ampla]